MSRDRLTATAQRLLATFRGYPAGQKVMVVAGVLAIVAGGWFFATWARTADYAPLFSNLAAKDAAAIVDELTAAGTPYELADGGQTVMVPKGQLYQLRLRMSAAGLPAQEDTGYSLLDQQGVTTSEFMQQVGYQRALEGELARTIKSIDGVNTATVHLVIPQKDVFSDDSTRPTAAVMVDTTAGRTLSGEQVEAVVHLVAASVEGLDPDDVTVAGSDGTVLAAPGQGGIGAAGAGGRAEETAAFEQSLARSLQQLLGQVVGPDHAVVKVTAELDFDESETKSQTYTSDPTKAPLSESTSTESYTGTGAPTGGVLGQTNGTTAGTGTGTGTYQQNRTVRDNAVDTVIETRRSAPGTVRRLGLAILLDQTTAGAVDMAEVQRLVSSAAGLDTQRGDTIAVSAMPFDTTTAQRQEQELAEAEAADSRAQLFAMAKNAAMVTGALLVLLVLWLRGRRRRKRRRAEAADELERLELIRVELERTRGELTAGGAAELTAGGSAAGELTAGTGIPSGPTPQERKLKEIEALVDEQPDDVARLLRGWLATKGS